MDGPPHSRLAPPDPSGARILPDWEEEAIGRHHDRGSFDCGAPDLDEYLRRFARQNHTSGSAKTFVAVPKVERRRVLGYYSICPADIESSRVPAVVTRKLARYPVPVFRLARLAVDRTMQGRGLGAELLFSAGQRALSVALEAGGVALAIDAVDDKAAVWYGRFGAVPLLDDPLRLVLPLDVIAGAITSAKAVQT